MPKKQKNTTQEDVVSPQTKYKQISITNFYVSPAKEHHSDSSNSKQNEKQTKNKFKAPKKRLPKGSSQNSNLNCWLSKSKLVDVKPSQQIETECDLNGSFMKYGTRVPSFNTIVTYKDKYKFQKEILSTMDAEESQKSMELDIDESCDGDGYLDCKHLSCSDIKKLFKENRCYLQEICDGTRASERCELYHKNQELRNKTLQNMLQYNTSMSVFTETQKRLLVKKLHRQFAENDRNSHNTYLFQVLLPELCHKIFMDVHRMSYEEAAEYLENRPM